MNEASTRHGPVSKTLGYRTCGSIKECKHTKFKWKDVVDSQSPNPSQEVKPLQSLTTHYAAEAFRVGGWGMKNLQLLI